MSAVTRRLSARLMLLLMTLLTAVWTTDPSTPRLWSTTACRSMNSIRQKPADRIYSGHNCYLLFVLDRFYFRIFVLIYSIFVYCHLIIMLMIIAINCFVYYFIMIFIFIIFFCFLMPLALGVIVNNQRAKNWRLKSKSGVVTISVATVKIVHKIRRKKENQRTRDDSTLWIFLKFNCFFNLCYFCLVMVLCVVCNVFVFGHLLMTWCPFNVFLLINFVLWVSYCALFLLTGLHRLIEHKNIT